MTKRFLLFAVLCLSINFLQAQTAEELKAKKKEKEAQIKTLGEEVVALEQQIYTLPGWKFGAGGTIGINFSQFNNWLGGENANTRAGTFGLTGGAFANLDREKYLWRNSANLVFTRTGITTTDIDFKDLNFETSADAFNITSLFGYKLTEQFAISAFAEYRTTIRNFNNPGYLDIGVGGTWKPITDLVVVIHPLNYNIVFSNLDDFEYESSLGAKIVADYTKKLPMGIGWKSNLTAFLSYKDSSLSNWTWVNGFTTAYKGIGIGFDFGLRSNKQEFEAFNANTENLVKLDENPLQTYWLLGLTYNL